jgi:hypothetical protein
VNDAVITEADYPAGNSYVQVINKVLVPPESVLKKLMEPTPPPNNKKSPPQKKSPPPKKKSPPPKTKSPPPKKKTPPPKSTKPPPAGH